MGVESSVFLDVFFFVVVVRFILRFVGGGSWTSEPVFQADWEKRGIWTDQKLDRLRRRQPQNQVLIAFACKHHKHHNISLLLFANPGMSLLFTSFPSFFAEKAGDLSFLLKALSYRERVLQRSLAARLYTKVSVTGALSEEKTRFLFSAVIYFWAGGGGVGASVCLVAELIGTQQCLAALERILLN